MSSNYSASFTKSNLDTYLKALAKEYKRLGGKNVPAELVLIGGASVLINYGFRDTTTDIDAAIQAASTMKDAINRVGDEFNLPNGWLNDDFKKTESYTPKILQYSKYYKQYYNVMTVRTVSSEYLIAMKLVAGRQYKNDLSDIIGILAEHKAANAPISIDKIKKAVVDLYGDWDVLSDSSKSFIENAIADGDYEAMRKTIANEEESIKDALLEVTRQGHDTGKMENRDDILKLLKGKK